MKTASLIETRENLNALVDQVQHGETVLIFDGGRPVARLVAVIPMESKSSAEEARLTRLERRGIVDRGRPQAASEILAHPPVRAKGGASALAELLDERHRSR